MKNNSILFEKKQSIVYIGKHFIFYIFPFFFILYSSFSYAQTFSNTEPEVYDSWVGPLTKTIIVSGLPSPLSSPSNVLRQVNIDLGDNVNSANLSTFTITLTSPDSTIITIVTAGGPTSIKRANVKYREHSVLRSIGSYGSTKEPFDIGYYGIVTANGFSSFNGEDPNGTWNVTITEGTSFEIAYNRVDLIFGPAFVYSDISASTTNDTCIAPQCVETGTIIIGTNNGYTGATADPALTLDGCSWNAAKNNSAWFSFTATGTTAKFTISGVNNKLQILGYTLSGSCDAPTYSLVSGGCPDDIINDTYTSAQYTNGCNCNMQLNMSDLTVGNTYYFIVDGEGGVVSPFYVEIDNAQSCINCTVTASITDTLNVLCNSASTGSATVTPSSGTSPYSYKWSNGQSDSIATGLIAGNYFVTITDNALCTATASVTISDPAAISITTNITDATCGNVDGNACVSSVSGGTSPYNYSWSNGSTTSCTGPVSNGSYTITITDTAGCIFTEIVNVNDAGAPTIDSTSIVDLLCNGNNDGSAIVYASGGVVPYSYKWSNGQSDSIATGLIAGNYSVTITDNSLCIVTASVTISEPTAISITTNITDATCGNADGNACVSSVSGGTSPYSYSWSNGSTTSCTGPVSNGSYTVTVTDTAGCIFTEIVNVNDAGAPTIDSTSIVDLLCNGNNDGSAIVYASGGIIPYSYQWSNGQSDSIATGLIAGNYFVTITDNSLCTATASVTISEPAAITVNLSSVDVTCYGGNDGQVSVISVSGGTTPFTYAWSTGETTQNISGLSAGAYSLMVTDNNACTKTATALIGTNPILDVDIGNDTTICEGGSLLLNAGYPFASHIWQDGSSDSVLLVTSSGIYFVTVTDTLGCIGSDSIQVQASGGLASDIITTGETFQNAGDGSADLTISEGTPPYSYQWSNGETTEDIFNLIPGTYFVIITDDADCVIQDSAVVKASDSKKHYYIPNIFSPNKDGANDELFLLGKGIKEFQFVIYDRWGEKVFKTTDIKQGWDGTYKGKPVNSGVYVYYITGTYEDGEGIMEHGNITIVR